MGAYVYKISTKPVGQFKGEPVYPSTYAYKPYSGWDTWETQANRRMSFRTGVESLGAAWRRKSEREGVDSIYVLYGGSIIKIGPWGAFIDDALDPTWVVGTITELEVKSRGHLTKWCPLWETTLSQALEAAV